MQYATFRDRITGNALIVDNQGVKARNSQRNLRGVCDLIPFILVGLYGWYGKGLRFTDLDSFCDFFFLALLPQNLLVGFLWYMPAIFTKTKRTPSDYLAGTFVARKTDELSRRGRLVGLLKGGVCVTGLFLIFLAAILITYMSIDRPLDPEAKKFFYDDPFPKGSNFFAAWAGLNAPPGEKDTYSYGLDVIEEKIEPDKDKELHFKGNVDNLCHWQKQLEKDKICATPEEIAKLVSDNSELLSRYEAIYRQTFKNYSVGDKFNIHGSGQDTLNLQRLLAAEWAHQAKTGHGREALDEWLVNTQSLQRVLKGKMTIVEHAIWMIAYGWNLSVLPVILESNSALIPTYKDKIFAVLDYDFMKMWDVAAMMRADFNWQYSVFPLADNRNVKLKKNDTRNKMYRLAKDTIELSKLPAKQIPEAFEKLHSRYQCNIDFQCVHYNPVGNLMLSGEVNGGQLFVNGHKKTASQRMLLLWIEAKLQNLPSSRMEDFVKSAPENRLNPLTEKPFLWDEKTGSIYYEWQGNRTELYY